MGKMFTWFFVFIFWLFVFIIWFFHSEYREGAARGECARSSTILWVLRGHTIRFVVALGGAVSKLVSFISVVCDFVSSALATGFPIKVIVVIVCVLEVAIRNVMMYETCEISSIAQVVVDTTQLHTVRRNVTSFCLGWNLQEGRTYMYCYCCCCDP